MKKALWVLAVFGLGVAVGSVIKGKVPLAEAGGAAKCAGKNGDVNADGKVDISDAITVLGYLFLGTPTELVPLCGLQDLTARIQELEGQLAKGQADLAKCLAANCPPSGLPATGRTKCHDESGAVIPCDSAACPGQDGFYATGCPSEGRFVDNGDRTVTDNCTGLMWQQDTADVNGDGRTGDGHDFATSWCGALAYCENLSFAGHNDWRSPNVRELQSIVDYGRFNPVIDQVFGALTSFYWSSSSFAGYPYSAWGISFGDGYVSPLDNDDLFYVRAVRSGP